MKSALLLLLAYLSFAPVRLYSQITQTPDSCTGTLTLTAPIGDSYLWSNGATTQSIVVNHLGYYEVAVEQNGCPGTVGITISSLPLPSALNISIILGTNQSSTTLLSDAIALYPQLAGGMNNENVLINGSLELDLPAYNIQNCNLHFSYGAGIDVLQNGYLLIENTILDNYEFCNSMWEGIRVAEAGMISILNSSILDAHFGIELSYKTIIKSFNTNYVNNYIGILMVNRKPGVNQALIANDFILNYCSFENNHFYTTSQGLLPLYPGQSALINVPKMKAPQYLRKSFAGIYAINVKHLDFTSQGLTYNHFDKLEKAIVLENYNGSSKNWKVTKAHITNCNSSNYGLSGISDYATNESSGVYAYSKKASHSIIEVYDCDIENTENGIFVSQLNSILHHNAIDAIRCGIYQISSINCTMSIYTNTISNIGLGGIYLANNAPHNGIRVNDNEISSNGTMTKTTGISVIESAQFSNATVQISHNILAMFKANSGIYLRNIYRGFVEENVVNLMPQMGLTILNGGLQISTLMGQTRFGIQMIGCTRTELYKNEVGYTGSAVSAQIGDNLGNLYKQPVAIGSFNSDSSLVNCNTTNKTYSGLLLSGMSSNTRILGNEMQNHHTGLRYSTVTGTNLNQDHAGNLWTGSYTGWAAFNNNFANSGEYRINPINSQLFPPVNTISPILWFQPDYNGTAYECPLLKTGIPPQALDENSLKLAAEGKLDVAEYETELNLQAQRKLFEDLSKDSSLLGLDPKIDSFYQASQMNDVKLLYEAQELGIASKLVQPAERQYLLQDQQSLTLLYAQIAFLDSLYQDSLVNEAQYINSLESYYSQIELKDSSLIFYQSIVQQAEQNMLDQARAKYDEVQQQYLLDYNTKYTEQVWLESLALGEAVDSMHYLELYSIAEQCPMAGGKGVYAARALINSFNIDTFWLDELRCLYQGYDIKSLKDTALVNTVFPNPTHLSLTIQLKKEVLGKVQVKIYNLEGQMLLSDSYPYKKEHKLFLYHFPAGVYLLQVTNEQEELIHTEKIIIE
ncbi:MAG: T9SS type A sorting domain-containing protein [Bacteroidetes bacterium]|nr:T9SS type A sorting domain-containing protein [Bacteroidota bacterium]